MSDIILTTDEVKDPKNSSKIAHMSCSRVQKEGEPDKYCFSGLTESAKKKAKILKKSKN